MMAITDTIFLSTLHLLRATLSGCELYTSCVFSKMAEAFTLWGLQEKGLLLPEGKSYATN